MATINAIGVSLFGQTGTGSFVGGTSPTISSPTLTSPVLGTPASGNLANCLGYSAANISGVTAIANGGTNVSSLPTTASASAFAAWNAQGNMPGNAFLSGYTTTATAAGTTTLTVASTQQQYFTGSTTQTVVLPVTSTLVLGQKFEIVNNSTGIVTVQSSGANTVQAMASGSRLTVTCILTSGTTAASWSSNYTAVDAGGTVTSVAASVPSVLSISGSPITTSGTLAISYSGTALPIANGGTGLTTTPGANKILIGTGSAYALNELVSDFGNTVSIGGGFCSIDYNGQIPNILCSLVIGTNLTPNVVYIQNSGSLFSMKLPATGIEGDWVEIVGYNAASWEITQAASQFIFQGSSQSTTGTGGKIAPANAKTTAKLICVATSGGVPTGWAVQYASGTINFT